MHAPPSCFSEACKAFEQGDGRKGTLGMETLKAIGRKWNSISLIKRILVGLIIGAIVSASFQVWLP